MSFCSKCGAKLSEGTKFCASCGTAVSQNANVNGNENTSKQTTISANEVVASVTQVAQRFSLTPKLLCAGVVFALMFLYYFVNYLGPWSLSFWTFLNNLLVPALFAGLIFTQAKSVGKFFYFITPFGLRALCALYFMFRNLNTVSFQNGIIWLTHIALAVLFTMTVLGKFDGKKIMLGVSAAVGIFSAIFAFRNTFMSGLLQFAYFGSVFVLIMELNLPSANANGKTSSNNIE